MRRRLVACLLLGSLACAMGPASAQPRTKSYVAGSVGDMATICEGANVGGACFDVPRGTYNVVVADAHGRAVGFSYEISGDPLPKKGGCSSPAFPAKISMPADGRITIYLDGAASWPFRQCAAAFPATNGTITLG